MPTPTGNPERPMTGLLTLLVVEAPLVALLYASYRRENGAALVNSLAGVVVTATPAAVEFTLGALGVAKVSFTPLLTLWTGVANVLHGLGMLGYYESVRWWDHLTHALSAALVTALVYAGLLVQVGSTPDGSRLGLAAAALAVVLVLSLVWEVAEVVMRSLGRWYGVEPVLVYYGRRDTAFDLVFDVVGAVLVLAVDLRLFVPVFEQLAAAL